MDIEQMKKDLGGGNVFPIGEENVHSQSILQVNAI